MAISHIVIAMKPVEGNFVENALKHGVAGINIDACRIGTTVDSWPKSRSYAAGQIQPGGKGNTQSAGVAPSGRFPANIILGHAEGCVNKGTKKVKSDGHHSYKLPANGGLLELGLKSLEDKGNPYAGADGKEEVDDWQCVEGCPVRVLGEQSGESESRASMDVMDRPNFKNKLYGTGMGGTVSAKNQHNDAGTAARFFKQVSEYKE